MLLDDVAGCPAKTLGSLAVAANPGTAPLGQSDCRDARLARPVRACDDKARLDSTPGAAVGDGEASFLLLVRGALSALVKPTSGLTIAYTAMVVGSRRGEAVKLHAVLAGQASAGLLHTARWHRLAHHSLLAVTLLLTVAAVWDSARVALSAA